MRQRRTPCPVYPCILSIYYPAISSFSVMGTETASRCFCKASDIRDYECARFYNRSDGYPQRNQSARRGIKCSSGNILEGLLETSFSVRCMYYTNTALGAAKNTIATINSKRISIRERAKAAGRIS